MRILVQLFAVARQRANADTINVELPEGSTVADLREQLLARVPELRPLAAYLRFAVNAEYAADNTVIAPGADVACIPPVSGG